MHGLILFFLLQQQQQLQENLMEALRRHSL